MSVSVGVGRECVVGTVLLVVLAWPLVRSKGLRRGLVIGLFFLVGGFCGFCD